ncbi:hypothetical protein Gogos_015371, partial [Gossypium gossypioides]|nr:hypothetical protein [Gossypium gossypioides]
MAAAGPFFYSDIFWGNIFGVDVNGLEKNIEKLKHGSAC